MYMSIQRDSLTTSCETLHNIGRRTSRLHINTHRFWFIVKSWLNSIVVQSVYIFKSGVAPKVHCGCALDAGPYLSTGRNLPSKWTSFFVLFFIMLPNNNNHNHNHNNCGKRPFRHCALCRNFSRGPRDWLPVPSIRFRSVGHALWCTLAFLPACINNINIRKVWKIKQKWSKAKKRNSYSSQRLLLIFPPWKSRNVVSVK